MNKFTNYCLQNNELSPEYLTKKFDTDLQTITKWLCDIWHLFKNPRIYNKKLITNYPKVPWYYEVCDTQYKRGNVKRYDKLELYCLNNKKENQHISVYGHDKSWYENLIETGSPSCRGTKLSLPWLWIEIDRKDYKKRPDYQKAIDDAFKVKDRVYGNAKVYTSGNVSTHVLINAELFGNPIISDNQTQVVKNLAHLVAGDIRFNNKLYNVYSLTKESALLYFKMAYPNVKFTEEDIPNGFNYDPQAMYQAIENIDPNIYHKNALIRQPLSYHEKGNGMKKPIDDSTNLFDFPKTKPYLLYLWFKAYDMKKIKKKIDKKYDSSYIVNEYKKIIPEIDEEEANHAGYVGPFHNPFYDDGNASVYVNLNTGYMKDFGSNIYSLTFDEVLTKIKENVENN